MHNSSSASPFCKAHPNIDVRFTVGNPAQIIERVEHNKDDLYIFSQPPVANKRECMAFMADKLVVIAPPDSTGPNQCRLGDIAEQTFLLRELGSGTRRAVEDYCNSHRIKLSNLMIIQSNEALRLAVASGLGLSILSEHTLAQSSPDSVKVLNIEDFSLTNHWQAVTVRNRPISLAAQAFR